MKREGGYTIVETGLAIAVSASLVLLTVGLGTMVGRRRFQDSLTTVQSFIQTQYNEVRSGINSRLADTTSNLLGCGTSGAGNNPRCYMMGRLLTVIPGTDGGIKSSYIVAKPSDPNHWPNTTYSGLQNLQTGVTLYAVTNDTNDAGLNSSTKLFGYGSDVASAWTIINGTVSSIDPASANIALLRSPTDGSMIIATNVGLQTDTSSGTQRITLRDSGASQINMDAADKLVLGIRNGTVGQQGGLICIAGGDSSAGVSNNNNVNLNDFATNSHSLIEACGNWEQ